MAINVYVGKLIVGKILMNSPDERVILETLNGMKAHRTVESARDELANDLGLSKESFYYKDEA